MTGADLEWPGRITCFGAASCYAISSVVMRRLAPLDPIGLAAVSLLIGSGFLIVKAFVIQGPPPAISSTGWGLLFFFGPFSDRAGKSFAGAGDQNRRHCFPEFDQLSSAALVCYFWNFFVE